MGITAWLILLMVTAYSDAQTCVKIDECSCHLTGVEQTGVIDLHSLVSGEHEPTFTIRAKSEQTNMTYVTVSGKTGLIAHLKVSRNVGFKYSVCCSWPMVVATHTKFSHVSQQFLTFLIIH